MAQRNTIELSPSTGTVRKMSQVPACNSFEAAQPAPIVGAYGQASGNMLEKRGGPVRIALAEDEPDIRRTFVKLLEHLGHEVIYAVSNGAELLDQSLEENIDVVFVDLDMPVMDGLAAAEEVERKGIPVILVSGHPDSDSVVLDHEPIVARISKPASLESLKNAIALALAGR